MRLQSLLVQMITRATKTQGLDSPAEPGVLTHARPQRATCERSESLRAPGRLDCVESPGAQCDLGGSQPSGPLAFWLFGFCGWFSLGFLFASLKVKLSAADLMTA